MRMLIFFIVLLVTSGNTAAETLSSRLKEAGSNREYAEQVISRLQTEVRESLTAEDYLVLSESHQTLRQREAALEASSKAEANAPDAYLKAYSLLQKAQIYGILFQDVEKAVQELAAAEQHLNPLSEPNARLLLADVLDNFASAYNVLGELDQGLVYAKRSLQLAQELESPSRRLAAHIKIARLALQKNQYKLAFNQLQQGLDIATDGNDVEQIAAIHFRMGTAYRKLDQHETALFHFEQAAERYQQLSILPTYTSALIYMAETYMEEPRQLDKAASLLQEARELSEQLQHKRNTSLVYYSLGRLALYREDFAQSERYYQQALQLFTQSNTSIMVQEATLAIITLYIEQQRYQEAEQLLTELTPTIDDAALFLRFRYTTNAVDLAVAAADWQRAYQLQQQLTTLKQEQLTEQIQDNLAELTDELAQLSAAEQQAKELAAAQHALATAESRQVLLQALLVLLIFIAFVIWQLYRRQQMHPKTTVVPELAPRQWEQFREKVKLASQQQPLQLLVLVPRQRASLQRRFGRRVVSELLEQVAAEVSSPILQASFSGPEMLWLASASQDKAATKQLLTQASDLLQTRLKALGTAPILITAEFELAQLLGPNWHKQDLNGLTDALWFGWYLAEQQQPEADIWQLSFETEHVRPCEWQVDDLRNDLVNACRLGELTIKLNQQTLSLQQYD